MGQPVEFLPLMKTNLLLLSCLLPLILTAHTPKGIAEGNNKFAFSFYHRMQGSTANENQCWSPFSISTALAMVYAGARNETALQMSRTLNFEPSVKFHDDFRKLLKRLDEGTEGKIRLNIANGLWAQRGFEFLDAYLALAHSRYGSELENIDFKDEAAREKTRIDINSWVEKKTNNRIKDLLGRGDLNSMTRLVLVNAIYFYGEWAESFKKESTRPDEFMLTDGTRITVPFMNRQDRYGYYEDQEMQVLEIPYRGNRASMVIFLPKKDNLMEAFTSSLDYKHYGEIMDSMKFTGVRLSLPKFRIDFKLDLANTLSEMGMPLAFSQEEADFSGMTGKRDLSISNVIHQAFISVDEKGTEAAAATAVTMCMMAAPNKVRPVVFNADHPFVFLIRDNETGSILFMGRIMKPVVPE